MRDKLSKRVLRSLWIILIIVLFANCFIILYAFPKKVNDLIRLIPYLSGLITIMATIAFGGSQVKRLTEGFLEKAKNGGGENEKDLDADKKEIDTSKNADHSGNDHIGGISREDDI